MPLLLMFGGPNGSGKSTYIAQMQAGIRKLVVALPERILNPDDFARAIDPIHPDRVAVSAGRAVLANREALLSARLDFAIETTLSGQGELRLLDRARSLGYRVVLVYVATERAVENVIRVERRREEQNRSVPPAVVLRRFKRSLDQLSSALERCDLAYILDNTHFDFAPVLTLESGSIVSISENIPQWASKALSRELRGYQQPRT